ncbi:MAG: efflux RND transporter periplasmic adaptor subunit, partial [Bacteroidota bacterium]
MRKIIQTFTPVLLALLLIVSCAQPTSEAWPEDLAGKKTLLKEKKAAIKTLNQEIDTLLAEIASLEPKLEKPRKLVTTNSVPVKDFKRFIEIQSSITSDDVVFATSETGGRLLSVLPKEGKYVSKGALIATVDLEAVNKQIAELETSLELADEVFQRQERLWKQNIGSEIQYLQAKNSKERLEKS